MKSLKDFEILVRINDEFVPVKKITSNKLKISFCERIKSWFKIRKLRKARKGKLKIVLENKL